MSQFRREPLTVTETEQLTHACNDAEEKIVIWTLLETGIRVSELASLTRSNIDFQTHRLTVYGKGRGGKRVKKGVEQPRSKRRVIGISSRLRQLLEPYMLTHERFDVSKRTIQRIVTRVASRAGITRAASPHVLRHTFAVTALRKGIDIRTLQEWLGHENLQTTALYLNLSPDAVIREFEEKW